MSVPFLRDGFYIRDDDYYVILDVDFRASQETIVSAYRNLARKYHPDKHNQDERSRKEAELIFSKIKTAYDVLSDPRKRQIYDTLGVEGLKIDGWILVKKQVTAQEIRDEYLRLQKKQQDDELAKAAKPHASFTLSINASELFSNHHHEHEDDIEEDEDYYYSRFSPRSLVDSVCAIEISSMSATVSVENYLATNHSVSLTGNLNTNNGIGEGSLGTNYRFRYSPSTELDLLYLIGRGPILSTGLTHKLNRKTSLSARANLVVLPGYISPVFKLTMCHRIRDYLTGKMSYREGINSSVTTSLIYINKKLMIDVITSYKLTKLHQQCSVKFGYNFNNNDSRLSINMVASSDEGLAVEYACNTKVLEINVIEAALSFSIPAGVTLKFRYCRANHEFSIPIYLSDEVQSAPIFYGTMVPLVAYYLLDRYYLRHYKRVR